MKVALKSKGSEENFEIQYRGTTMVLRCLVALDATTVREFKFIAAEAALYQPIESITVDFQDNPVDPDIFQVIVQTAMALKQLHRKCFVLGAGPELARSVAANGLSGLIILDSDLSELLVQDTAPEKPQTFPAETRFLLVDDIPSVRSLLKAFLIELGYRYITEAGSAEEAISHLDSGVLKPEAPALIFSDWYMPGMNGLQFHRRVREQSAHSHAAFVLLTVETERNNVLRAYQEGVKYYLVKPFRLETLEEKLKEIWAKEAALRTA